MSSQKQEQSEKRPDRWFFRLAIIGICLLGVVTITVTNNLQAKEVVKKSSGVGLTNIKQRYPQNTQPAQSEEKISIYLKKRERNNQKSQKHERSNSVKKQNKKNRQLFTLQPFLSQILQIVCNLPPMHHTAVFT